MNQASVPVYLRLLGAPGTGKSRLAAELAQVLSTGKHSGPPFIVEDNPTLPFPLASPTCATLLMGLDLPVAQASADLQQAADHALRGALAHAGLTYQVVYGQGDERLRNALSALQAGRAGAGAPARQEASRARWVWACDNCSDPQCERRLLSDLLAGRAAAAP